MKWTKSQGENGEPETHRLGVCEYMCVRANMHTCTHTHIYAVICVIKGMNFMLSVFENTIKCK